MKYVIFSFDDGRKDQYEIGYKVLKEYGFPATINVVVHLLIWVSEILIRLAIRLFHGTR